MFERPSTGDRAILVHLSTQNDQEELSELTELTLSAGITPIASVIGSRKCPDPRYYIGCGKLEELKHKVAQEGANLVLFNHPLSPSQERNLESALELRVVDRNGLILDIFAQRAKSYEGKLQVELAQLSHLSTRLVRGWSHLERQKGGIGLRGPGESQLETDRRLIGKRIKTIRRRLEKVEKQRHQGRHSRQQSAVPTVAVVGYTNAGKSTLFNQMTGANVFAKNRLFATLDPILRKCELTDGSSAVLADTVGFIRNLPHELISAFRATLQEACEADILLHVINSNAENKRESIEQVNEVLTEIGAGAIPQIEVYNKIDLTEGVAAEIERSQSNFPNRVRISAKTGEGIDLVFQALTEAIAFKLDWIRKAVYLPPVQADVRSKLFDVGTVLKDEIVESGGWNMEFVIKKKDLGVLSQVKITHLSAEIPN